MKISARNRLKGKITDVKKGRDNIPRAHRCWQRRHDHCIHHQ
jgi:hypothetical protein